MIPLHTLRRALVAGLIAVASFGAQSVLTAAPDGHTLMFTSSSLTVLDPLMRKQLPYDPQKDFAPASSSSWPVHFSTALSV